MGSIVEEKIVSETQMLPERSGTAGTDPGEKTDVFGSSASTNVKDRLRMIESSMIRADVARLDEWRGCAQTSNSASNYRRMSASPI